ncbi:MAG: 50S ribosomal protein L31e [Candidatus Methanofastidiosia archaeon]
MMNVGEERVYVIPLRKIKEIPRTKRSPRAMREIRSFLQKHTKTDDVWLDKTVNEKIWKRGIEKPPSRIRVRVVKEEVEGEEGAKIKRVSAFLAE